MLGGQNYQFLIPTPGPAPVKSYYSESQDGSRQVIIIYYGNCRDLPDAGTVVPIETK